MVRKNKKELENNINDEEKELLPVPKEQISEEGDITEEEHARALADQPIETHDGDETAKKRIADQILDTPPERMAELTITPGQLIIPTCLKETQIYIMKQVRQGTSGNGSGESEDLSRSPWEFLIARVDQRMRSWGGAHLKRAVLLAGDEAKERDDDNSRFTGGMNG